MPSIRDDDEDTSPPLRAGAPLHQRPLAAAAKSAPLALSWGVCGAFHEIGELIAFPGEQGVIRYVASGNVRYAPPPVGIGCEWKAVPSEPTRYEIVWVGSPVVARKMSDLRRDLEAAARGQQFTSPTHPLLIELDTVAVAVARLLSKLHAAGWSVGLLRPDSLVLVGRDVAPIDLGFHWKGSFGVAPWDDSPGRPDWLEPNGPFTWLYDHAPVRQQFADPDNREYAPPSTADDIRTVGRLLAWLMSGHEARTLPHVREASAAWAVVADAANGAIANADDLAARFRKNPPSGYFVREPEPLPLPPPQRPWIWKVIAVVVLLGLAAVGLFVAWPYLNEKPPSSTKATEPDRQPNTEPKGPPDLLPTGLLNDIDKTPPGDISGLFDRLAKAYKGYATATPKEKMELDARRAKAVTAWTEAFLRAEALAAEPIQRLEAAKLFPALKSDLEKLVQSHPASDPEQNAKEKQCLDFVTTRVRELAGSPP